MNKIFLPLQEDKGKFKLEDDYINKTIFITEDDDNFLTFLNKHFSTIKGDIQINKFVYNNINIYKPSENIKDSYYVEVNKELIPVELVGTGIQKINSTFFENVFNDTVKSEVFYNHLYSRLDNLYINPIVRNEEGEDFQFNDYNILLNESKLLLIGGPGTGKTSLLRKLTYEINKKVEKGSYLRTIPIYIKLRDLNFLHKENTINRLISQQFELINNEYALEAKKEKRILFIFDGLDELEKEDRNRFTNWLNSIHKKNSDYRIIVSSRKIRELDDIPCFEYYSKLELLPFNNEQIRSLIYRYISDDEERQNFYSLIKFNSDLNLLLSNPLLLSLSIGIYLIKKVLPSSLPTLVEEIITHLLERWDSSRQINRYKFLNHHEAKNILENISFNLFKDKKQVFDENYAISCLPYKYKKSKINELLKEIEESTSLIFNQKEKWSFSHVLYKEFFCANYLIENSRGIESEYTKYNKMIEWRNVWNTAIYKSNDPEFYIRELKRYNQNEYLLELNRILNILFKAQYKGKDVEKRLINLLKETTTKLKSSLQIEFKSKELILLRTSKASKINSSLLNDLINTFSVIGINEEEYPKDIFRFKAENDIDNLIKILVVNKCYVSVRDQDSYVSIKLINTGANK